VADIRAAASDEVIETVQSLPEAPIEQVPSYPPSAPTPPAQSTSQDTLRLSSGTLLLVPKIAEVVRRSIPPPTDRSGRRWLWLSFGVAALVALPLSFFGGVALKRHFAQPTPLVDQFTDPRDAFRFGDQALKDGRYQIAIVALTRAVELDEQYALAHRRLADAFLSNGLIDEAKRHYRRYLELEPEAADAERIHTVVNEQ